MYVERESTAERPVAHAAIESECIVTDRPWNIRPEKFSNSQKSTSPTGPHQPTYVKASKEHLAIDTLLYYDVPYEVDRTDPNYIIILRELKPIETEALFEHTRRLRSRLLVEERREEKLSRTLRPSKSDSADPSAKFDVVKYIQKTREARKVIQSKSLDRSIVSEPTDKPTLPSRPLFERSPSPPSVLATSLRTRSSMLSLRGKRREYGSGEVAKKPLVGDRNDTSMEDPIRGYPEEKDVANSDGNPAPVGAPFAYKLYSMLEDQSIQHLISWSSTNDSFVFSPSSNFAQSLSSYFKHTNIPMFVRQLTMYGFLQVGDFHHDSTLWEFKHSNGLFERGDLVGLREIKRRIPKHTPIQHDIVSTPSSNFKHGGSVQREQVVAVKVLGSGGEQCKEDHVLEPNQKKAGRRHNSQNAHVRHDPVSKQRLEEGRHVGPKQVSPTTGYALPEIDSLIAGWQAMLPPSQAERDSGFHEGDTVDAPQFGTPDPTIHETNDRLMLDESDPLVLDHDITDDLHSIQSSETSPTNNAERSAIVEKVMKKLNAPKLVTLKKDQSTQGDRSGTDYTRKHVIESQHPTLEASQSIAGQNRMRQITSSSISRNHENDVSNGFPSRPDDSEGQRELPSLGEATASDGSEVGVVTTSSGNDYPFRFDHILRTPSPSNTDKTRESLLSNHEGSEDASDTSSTSHYDVGIQNALDSALNVVKGLMVQKLVGHALSEASDGTGSYGDSSRGPGVANEITSLQSADNAIRNNGGKRARGGGRDPDDEGGDASDEDDDDQPKKKGPSNKTPQRRLKCPFYQRQPEKYTRAACRGEGFADMAKLKDHLKRVHMQPWRCPRCHVEMSEEELEVHAIQNDACAIRTAPLDDRIAPQTLRKLEFKRAPFVNARSTEEKWKRMYKMLFPTDSEADIPSPYTHDVLSPDLARALSEALEEELNGEFAQFLEPAITHIKARIPAIMERCRTNLAIRAGNATVETNIRPPLPESSKSPCVMSETGRLRRKKKSNKLTRRLDNSSEVFLQPATAVRKQPQYSPVPQMTPGGSSEESEETSTASASASVEQIAHIDSMEDMCCSEPTANILGVDDWATFEPSSVPVHSGLDTNLDFGLPPACAGIGEQNPALRPYQNDPYLYGGSASFSFDGMESWSNMATLERKGVDGYPPAREQRLDEVRLSMPPTTDWHFTERDHFP